MTDAAQGIMVRALCLSRTHAHFPEPQEITKNVDLQVGRGQILGIVGESGCGKSLTCQAIMGMLPQGIRQTGGSISVDGQEVRSDMSLQGFRGRTVSMILQNPSSCFDPIRTVSAQFVDTLRSHDLPCSRQGMEDHLRGVGFSDARRILDLYPYEMSGGMLQRVMIALALALGAPYLLADEPTTDLDPVAQQRVLSLLAELRARKGVGILLVSHDFSVMEHLADEVAVMYKGRILEQAPTAELLHAPQTPYGQQLVDAYGVLCRAWQAVPKEVVSEEAEHGLA